MPTGPGTQLPCCGAGVSQGTSQLCLQRGWLPPGARLLAAAERAAAGGSGSEGSAGTAGPCEEPGDTAGSRGHGEALLRGVTTGLPPLPLAVRKTGCVDKAGAVPAVRGSSWKRLWRAGRGSFSLLPMLGKCIEWTFLQQIKKLSVKSEAASLITALMSSPNPLLPTEHPQHGPKTSLMSPGRRGHAGRSRN